MAPWHHGKQKKGRPGWHGHFRALAKKRGEDLLEAHRRVRKPVRLTGVTQHIEPKLPVDILGIDIFLPAEDGP